jgi:cytochrome c biogenesis protein CcmG, thiol:disulfide interchange protein DsbE
MKKFPSKHAVAAGLILAAAALAQACAEPALRQPAPALTIETAAGRAFNLGALRGKVVLVNFWATWCAPCLAELPVLGKYYQAHREQGFEVIALSLDKPKDRARMNRLIATLPFEAALLSDASRNGFGTPEAVPVSYLVDAEGIVRDSFISVDEALLEEIVTPLLRKMAANPKAAELRQ